MSRPSPSSDLAARRLDRRRLLLGLAALPLLAAARRAAAQSAKLLDAPRIAGLIDRVNAERRAVYEKRAAADKAPIEAVQQIYAQQIRQSAPVGTWFLGADGQWTQK